MKLVQGSRLKFKGVRFPSNLEPRTLNRALKGLSLPALTKVVSGGQTGVDRAALDAAAELGVRCGGWCPRGRRAEDGSIPLGYPLQETPSSGYVQRTQWNVRDSDGTLILTRGAPTGGTAGTIQAAARLGRPCLIVRLDRRPSRSPLDAWMAAHAVRVLNVAGPRESASPGIYALARRFLRRALIQTP
jgi:hypothetical protein